MSEDAKEPVAIPGLWTLGWMLFMQPLRLHRLHRALGLEDERNADPSLLKLWPRLRGGDSSLALLVRRYAALLVVMTPVGALLLSRLVWLAGILVHWGVVAVVAATGVALGVVGGVVGGVARGVALGVVFGVAEGVALGAVGGAVDGVAKVLALGIAVGAAGGAALGLLFGAADGVAGGVANGVARGVALGLMVEVGLGLVGGVFGGGELGLVDAIVGGVVFILTFFRLPAWLLESLWTRCLSSLLRRHRSSVARVIPLLPYRHHDLIGFSLWGLRDLLVDAAHEDAALGQRLIDEAAATVGQRIVARDALIELRALELDRAARHDGFQRAADLSLPFLPPAEELADDDPLRVFQAVARDVVAGGANQRLRQQALARARTRLETFLTTPRSRRKEPFAHRLLQTAAVWLESVNERGALLEREMRERPQVPMVFVAGAPLRPAATEGSGLFKGRRDLATVLEQDLSPGRRGVMVVIGQRRMGKSSFALWLPRLLGTGTAVVRVDFQGLGGERHRAHPHRVIVDALAKELPGLPTPPTGDAWGDALTWLAAVEESTLGAHVLIVVDEVEKVEEGIREGWCGREFLDFARAVGDRLDRVRLLLLCARPLSRLGAHWPDRLISATVRTLGPLDEKAARELITKPIEDFPAIYPDGGVERILAETGRHPFLIQKVCDDLCRLLNERGGLRRATTDELDEVIEANAAELLLFRELWESRTPEERAVLQALARGDSVTRSTVFEALLREGFIARDGERYFIAVPMFQRWIADSLPSVATGDPAPLAPG